MKVVYFEYAPDEVGWSRRVLRIFRRLAMMKPGTPVVRGTGKLAADDPLAWKELPGWRRFFLEQTYDDGASERMAGVVIIKAGADGWQWTLKDPASCTMLRVTSRTWDEGLLLIEALLVSPDAPWETDPYEAGKRGRSRGRKS